MKLPKPSLTVAAICVGAAIGLLSGFASDVPGVGVLASGLTAAAIWLMVTGLLLLAGGLVFLGYYRRRHIRETRLRDASGEPITLRPFEQTWDAELAWLGFHRIGVLQLTGPADKPELSLHYSDMDGRISASINRRRSCASFSSTFADDAVLITRNKTGLPTVTLPFCQIANVPAPGDTLAPAYQAHLHNLPGFAAAHGEAIRIRSMAEMLASEERSRDSLVPRMLKGVRGWNHRLAEALVLLILFGAWVFSGVHLLALH
jgi:hypothetical protein